MKSVWLFLSALAALATFATGAHAAQSLPASLLVDGKPVDALCFEPVGGEPIETISVKGCGKDLVVKEREDKDAVTHSVSYTYADDPDGGMGLPYVQYDYVGESEDSTVVIVRWSGGGTGHFSSVMLLKREGDLLRIVKVLGGGDRCNGGIESAEINSHGQVEFKMNATPYELVVNGGDPERAFVQTLKPFDDLEACAICCLGTVNYTGDTFSGVSIVKENLESLGEDGANGAHMPEPQACFSDHLKSRGRYQFSAEEWKSLINDVEQVCFDGVKNKG